jgi:hypothetical protein
MLPENAPHRIPTAFRTAPLDIYSAAQKFETGVRYDFADVEGFSNIPWSGITFVTRATGVLFMRP